MDDLKDTIQKMYIGDTERKKCPYCGKEYKDLELTALKKITGSIKIVQVSACNCEEEHLKEERLRQYEENQKLIAKRRIEKMFENSMMTPFFKEKKFENLEMTYNLKFCQQYADDFIPRVSKGLQFIGNVGTGKTTALACVCNQLIENGYPCLFTTLSDLLDRFSKHSYDNAGDVSKLLDDLCKCDFVVLDDIGREAYTEKRKEFAFKIVDRLLNYKIVTAITANPESITKLSAISEWKPILDRLKDMCPIAIKFNDVSRRGLNVRN